jgi:hypothetical protein
MENQKNDMTLKALGGTMLAVLLSVVLLMAANLAMPFRQLEPGTGPSGEPPVDLHEGPPQEVFLIHAALSFAMLLLSLYLFFIYLKDYLLLKSSFTLGLMLAIFSFMLFAVTANPLLHMFFGVYGRGGIFPLIPYLFATTSLAILVYVSSK